MNKDDLYLQVEQHYRGNFRKLVDRYTRSLGSKAAAEDVVQEAVCNALTYWNTFNAHTGSFEQWFSTILKNCVAAHRRAEQMRGATVGEDELDQQYHDDGKRGYRAKQLREIGSLVKDKPQAQAYILRLYFFEQLKAKEIAKLVPETHGAVKAIIHRFRQEVQSVYS